MKPQETAASDFDVIVIGAGPAGASTAITALQRGLSVAILERSGFPRHTPGESLHPGIEPLLGQLGIWEEVLALGCLRYRYIKLKSNGSSTCVPFGSDETGDWLGMQVWRADLDRILLQQARALGATVFQPCHVRSPIVDEGTVVGVVTDSGSIRGGHIVDAAGGRHWLATHLQLSLRRESPPLMVQYGYVEAGPCDIDENPVIVTDACGWTWVARIHGDVCQWTRLAFTRMKKHHCPKRMAQYKALGQTRGADVTWRRVNGAAGPGYFLVGDAAAVLDPSSSHGVLKALMSGIMAAHCVGLIHDHGLTRLEAYNRFSLWLTHWFEHDVAILRETYRRLFSDM